MKQEDGLILVPIGSDPTDATMTALPGGAAVIYLNGGNVKRKQLGSPPKIFDIAEVFIGDPVVGGTPGALLYVGDDGSLSQNPDSLSWDNTTPAFSVGPRTRPSFQSLINVLPNYTVTAGAQADGLLVQPAFITAASGTHQILAGAYFDIPAITYNGANVTDADTVYIAGAPAAGGGSHPRALFIGAGNSVIKDKLGVGAVTTPDGVLTVFGPGDTNYTAHFQTANVPAPYGVWIEEVAAGASGYPLLVATTNGAATTWFQLNSGNGSLGIGGAPNTSYRVTTQDTRQNSRWRWENNATSNASNDTGDELYLKNASGTQKLYGYLICGSTTITAGNEQSTWTLGAISGGSNATAMSFVGLNLGIGEVPNSSYRLSLANSLTNHRTRFDNLASGNAANDIGFEYYLNNASAASKLYGYLLCGSSTITAGSEQSTWALGVMDGGSNFTAISVVGRAITIPSGVTLGVFGAAAVGRQNVTGSRGGNAALASLLTALATEGWITDSTSA